MDTDDVNNVINQQKINDNNQDNQDNQTNFFTYFKNIFSDNATNKNNPVYMNDDNLNLNFDQAYENISKLSKMNWNDLKNNLGSNLDNFKEYKFNSKYSNIFSQSEEKEHDIKYETDYEIKIDNDSSIKYIKIKK